MNRNCRRGRYRDLVKGEREILIVDWDNDLALQQLYKELVVELGRRGTLSGQDKFKLLTDIYQLVKARVKPDDTRWHTYRNKTVLVGVAVTEGGACRHMGIIMATLMERFL